jgi:predicted O-methyltransferase YrrM
MNANTTYQFDNDWFSSRIPNFESILVSKFNFCEFHGLEIGVNEGRCSFWFAENLLKYHPKSTLDVVDVEFRPNFWKNHEICPHREQIIPHETYSYIFLKECRKLFDFIYLDGNHCSSNTVEDAVMAWRLLKKGGILAFDDYTWEVEMWDGTRPKEGIDAFLQAYEGKYEILIKKHQVWIQKTTEEKMI